jgi:hypothetical protein
MTPTPAVTPESVAAQEEKLKSLRAQVEEAQQALDRMIYALHRSGQGDTSHGVAFLKT